MIPLKDNIFHQGFPTVTWTHDYPIAYEMATTLGLHVVKGIPPELYQLMSLYPQPVRHQPSVEYISLPRFKGPAPKP